jgi:hypothetical protein
MEGLGNSIKVCLHSMVPQKDLWEAVHELGDISSAASTCRKRSPQLPNDEHVQSLNWLLWLFPYLNHRPAGDRHGHSLAGLAKCRIPDTVVFINNSINNFFFSSVEDRSVKRKSRQTSCTRAAIMAHFRAVHVKTSTSDVVAYYVSLPLASSAKSAAQITYFDMADLDDFLLGKGSDSAGDGILQKFEDCSGARHTLYRAAWAPYNFTLESRTNKNALKRDPVRALSISERAATFDGGEHQSTYHQQGCNAYILRPIQQAAEKIVHHINGLLPRGYRVGRSTMYFKVSPSNEVLLLWCGSVTVLRAGRTAAAGQPLASELRPQTAPLSLDQALQHTDRYVRPRIPRVPRTPASIGSWSTRGGFTRTASSLGSSASMGDSWRSSRFASSSSSGGVPYSTRSYLRGGVAPPEPLAPRPHTPEHVVESEPKGTVSSTGTRSARTRSSRRKVVEMRPTHFQCTSCQATFTNGRACTVAVRCIVTHFNRLEQSALRRAASASSLRSTPRKRGAAQRMQRLTGMATASSKKAAREGGDAAITPRRVVGGQSWSTAIATGATAALEEGNDMPDPQSAETEIEKLLLFLRMRVLVAGMASNRTGVRMPTSSTASRITEKLLDDNYLDAPAKLVRAP